MGTETIVNQFHNCTKSELAKQVAEACRQAGFEDGHSYSGNWGEKIGHGLNITDKTFSSVSDAMDWLDDSGVLDSYGPLVAVKVLKSSKNIDTTKIDKQISELKTKRDGFLVQCGELPSGFVGGVASLHGFAVQRVQSQKSKLKGCDSCGSKVAIKHVMSHRCPVCGDAKFALTKTDENKIKTARNKASEADMAVEKLCAKRQAMVDKAGKASMGKSNWIWLVAGDCRS